MDFFAKMDALLDKLCKFVEMAAPIAQAVAPFTGTAAPAVTAGAIAANAIATATDKAIAAHQANQTTQQATVGLAAIAQAVVASGVVDAPTAAKITTIVQSLDPAIQAGLSQG